jgi:flavin-dependent dehydrogenase
MPGAVAALARLGVDPPGQPIAGIRYVADGVWAEHRFRGAPGRGVRRTALHDALLRRADEVGVRREAGRVAAVRQDATGVTAAGWRARWLLAADGLRSPVRRALGLDRPAGGRRRVGLRRHYRRAPWTDLVEVHWSAHAEAYVTPVAADLVGIAVLGPGGQPFDGWLADFPGLQARLAGATPAGPVRGAGPLRQEAVRRADGRVLLVGDASGYVDALTGEGIRVGLAQARAAVACLVAGRPAAYEARWRTITREPRWLTRGLLAVSGVPAVRPRLVPATRRLPAVFGALVEVLAR